MRIATGLLKHMNDVGSDFMITCPFHGNGTEGTPSCGVSKGVVKRPSRTYEAGTVHCYSCGYRADLPKFVADMYGLGTPMDGFRWLVGKYTYGSGDERSVSFDFDRDYRQPEPTVPENVMVTHYQWELMLSDRAQEYLRKRKITSSVWTIYGLGYNPDTDSIVIPVADIRGQVRMLKERSIEGKTFSNTRGANKAGLVYGLYQAMQKDPRGEQTIWVCESEIDALTVCSYGGIGIAQMGSQLSDDQIKEMNSTPFRKLLDGLDRDQAGRKGLRHMKNKLIPLGYRIWNTDGYGTAKDINELTIEQFNALTIS
jgi:DNA primase